MIKVMELVPTMSTGGAETMVKDYALLVDSDKIEIQVVVLDHHYDSLNEKLLDEHHIKTTYLGEVLYGERTDLNILQKIWKRFYRYYYFRKLVKAEKPDIIHVHLVLDKYLRFLPIKKQNIALVYTVHNIIDNYFSKDRKNRRKYKEYKECQRLINKEGMTLIALHDSMNRELREYFRTDKVITVNNGIQMDRFARELFDKEAIRTDLGIQPDDFLIGHVGRMHPQKNHDLILDVFMKVLEKKANAKLLLVGKGELEDAVRERIETLKIQDKVLMLKNRPDIPELMCAMDVFLFPSRWEGYGNVMLEAQCMGLPCVVSDKVPECVRVTDRVQVVPLSAPIEQWVQAVCNTGNAKHIVANMSDYDMKNCINRLEKVYTQIVME